LEIRHLAQHVCTTTCLEDFKAQEIGVKFIDKVPKLVSDKIQRKVMRDWAKRDAKEMEGTIKVRL